MRVRLNGINTSEIKGKCDKEKYDAEQVREMVGDILKDAKKITLKNLQIRNGSILILGKSLKK